MSKIACAITLMLGLASCAVAPLGAEAVSRADDDAERVDTEELVGLPGDVDTNASCTATCGTGTVSCAGSSCVAVNRDCANGQPGYVACDGVQTSCAACGCVEGQQRYLTGTGCCCDYDLPKPQARRILTVQTCVNGNWVSTGSVCGGQNCAGVCPL